VLAAWDVRGRDDRVKWWLLLMFTGPVGASLYAAAYSDNLILQWSIVVFVLVGLMVIASPFFIRGYGIA
jgi:hypothetical protein